MLHKGRYVSSEWFWLETSETKMT